MIEADAIAHIAAERIKRLLEQNNMVKPEHRDKDALYAVCVAMISAGIRDAFRLYGGVIFRDGSIATMVEYEHRPKPYARRRKRAA